MTSEQIFGLILAILATICFIIAVIFPIVHSSPGTGRSAGADCAPVDTAFFNAEKDTVFFIIKGEVFSWPTPK